jgi:hypothetical protein
VRDCKIIQVEVKVEVVEERRISRFLNGPLLVDKVSAKFLM